MNRINEDDVAAAELAMLAGGVLNEIDQNTVHKSSTDGSANKLNPKDFIKGIRQQNVRVNTTNDVPVNKDSIIEAPKSNPAGSEVVGTESVNLKDLLIPMNELDKETKEAMKRYIKPSNLSENHLQPQPQPQPQPQTVGMVAFEQSTTQVNNSLIIHYLEEINKKLDLIMKYAKIQPRYKKR